MSVAIVGGHGQIALRLTRRLADRGETVLSVIRSPDHSDDVRAHGGEPVVCDVEKVGEEELAAAIEGADAVLFAAGAGPGSGPERKLTMDRDGAVKALHAASSIGASRYVIVSAVGAENPPPPDQDDGFGVYLRAKAEADDAVKESELQWTILRPGRLTNDSGTGRVRIDHEPFRADIPRDDVAAVLDALLERPRAVRQILYLGGGEESIEEALGG